MQISAPSWTGSEVVMGLSEWVFFGVWFYGGGFEMELFLLFGVIF